MTHPQRRQSPSIEAQGLVPFPQGISHISPKKHRPPLGRQLGPMAWIVVVGLVVLVALLGGCGKKKKAPPRLVAGVLATSEKVTVTSQENKGFRRTIKAGMGLFSDQILEVPKGQRVVLEDDGTRFFILDSGTWQLNRIRGMGKSAAEDRPVITLSGGVFASSQVAPLLIATRYEPIRTDGLKRESEGMFQDSKNKELVDSAAFFFLRHNSDAYKELTEDDGQVDVPPWQAQKHRVRPLSRPPNAPATATDVKGQPQVMLLTLQGDVVVEFADHATIFADMLPTPFPLSDLARLVVLEGGRAEIQSPTGEKRRLKSGDVFEMEQK